MSLRGNEPFLDYDPLWYKNAIIYELHARAFFDADGDGVGDFRGLADKLDYLHDLGITAIWLLPFYPSPLKDDGYDIADYGAVNPAYGSLRDFRTVLREAHRRGIRVITELVLNHTSDQHAWFRRARRAEPGTRERDFFVWSDTTERYKDARIIFKDFESSNWTWDAVAKAYYWHRFYSHQPDLNFESAAVRQAVWRAVDFWLRMGVDGLRLDAVPYLYEREGTSSENLPETHAYLRELRRTIDDKHRGRMLLAEANQWPEEAAAYFGQDDECHMAFHFPLMPRLFMAIRQEDRFPIVDILRQTPSIPDNSQWALFLRNHDELTLEMVTDEDRDYMYRTYAHDAQARINLGIRRRLVPLLEGNRRKVELMNGLLFSLPGTPVIYYGDEIGMGDNIYLGDRDGVRTPMQWSSDRNAGFSRANPQRLYLPVIIDPEYHFETVNVEAQQQNPHSLLWWTKRIIALRKRYRAFSRGSMEMLYPENAKILAFIREYDGERILVVSNLSRFVQAVELDLADLEGSVPVELFGHTRFPPVGSEPYFLTLGPHSFYWFALEGRPTGPAGDAAKVEERMPQLTVADTWQGILRGRDKSAFEAVLPRYLQTCRWFGGKARTIQSTRIVDAVRMGRSARGKGAELILVRVEYVQGEPETYMLPLAFATGERADEILAESSRAVVARVEVTGGRSGIVYDAVWDANFCDVLLRGIANRHTFEGAAGRLTGAPTPFFRRLRGAADEPLDPTVLGAEQSNTSIVYGDRLILKLFRRPDQGVNPDLEIGRFLTERTPIRHVPQVAGHLEYRAGRREPLTIGLLHGYVHNEGDAWQYTLDQLRRYYEVAITAPAEVEPVETSAEALVALAKKEPPELAARTIGAYLGSARLLGQRTAELHIALASEPEDAAFVPEPVTPLYQRSMFQSMRTLAGQVFPLLRRNLASLPQDLRDEAASVLALEGRVERRYESLLGQRPTATRTRIHGDYHLGQVLYTGDDFVIIDFEGEPARALSERRLKRSPLRDVAGMLRSFHYAAYAALSQDYGGALREEDVPKLEPWACYWYAWTSAAFLSAYLDVAGASGVLPASETELTTLLGAFLLDKAVYELAYELNNRPTWVRIPLRGIRELVGTPE